MSHSVRLSDELVNKAKEQSKKFHRSAAQQIEHWAALGQMMEPVLSFDVRAKAEALTRENFERTLSEVETPEGRTKAQAVIHRTSEKSLH
ncbi:TA system antitoxin ParD family protein [Cerasicoccus arenae]|uniref:ParD-like antitoxin of type II toxin-antitoxin system n=1 Tax=Cerasicoccus arenae TaxID=424488 RepID=A0A8J3DB49_9BACT|nr:hypothetical protein [Cerasicoccus arenae]MBK1856818.1 hypothetical protein [Cerasicoccus arenae]GHB99691.1 hypothetical protein GCM10007047_15000 [Cerasicoccus arenae]